MKKIHSIKLCVLHKPIWIHCLGASHKEWLAMGSSLPLVAQHIDPTTHTYHPNVQVKTIHM